MLEDLARRDFPRPRGEERHAQAAVGEHALFAGEREVERAVPRAVFERRAVVADEDDERVALGGPRRLMY